MFVIKIKAVGLLLNDLFGFAWFFWILAKMALTIPRNLRYFDMLKFKIFFFQGSPRQNASRFYFISRARKKMVACIWSAGSVGNWDQIIRLRATSKENNQALSNQKLVTTFKYTSSPLFFENFDQRSYWFAHRWCKIKTHQNSCWVQQFNHPIS